MRRTLHFTRGLAVALGGKTPKKLGWAPRVRTAKTENQTKARRLRHSNTGPNTGPRCAGYCAARGRARILLAGVSFCLVLVILASHFRARMDRWTSREKKPHSESGLNQRDQAKSSASYTKSFVKTCS